ncbi:NUDIX hydrolase [Propionibacterium australiense]|uniref:NUDIX domain-containing protein n=1 Tax=Propionibacterium australiense TaxID=119981 RepID=A0A383SA06_9ACTN|nr:NUDIX domain-containing protein [Propionibacterium australiense]RLP09543.1 NUDIX domain-containing protein [Propionibacterium australiense]RLP09880.1 NUDIX domain-containing protein [Propionibacterium australiense]SYZ34189.1 NUDIX hydrolase domain [Propionibacterium australiense]VEH89437.1 Nucleoside triphosphatase nudI [Propionibacterium australiense]
MVRIVGVHRLVEGPVVDVTVGHGQDPRQLLWRKGWTVSDWMSASGSDDGIVLTARVAQRYTGSRMPRRQPHRVHAEPARADVEPVPHQRVAAYAIVRSSMGVLGTVCSRRTAVPGRWQLPGGGVEPGETPSQAVVREILEETDQHIRILRVVDLQSDHWIGTSPTGVLEDFQALRIIYTAVCLDPTTPRVLDVGGTTESARWVPAHHWRSLPWTSGARSALDRHLDTIPDSRWSGSHR